MTRHRLIVGVDYGTTYSGVSFVTTDKASLEDIHVIRTWPGKDGEWKTPTRIAYASENRKAALNQNLWGYQVEPGMISCSWTKLLLDSETKNSQYDDPSIRAAIDEGRLRLPNNRDAQGVAADFLKGLYAHMENKLIREYGKGIFDSTPMDCWLTVPAVWSDQAQNATKAAAKEAGFGARPGDSISLIPEPEAAAVAVLKNIVRPEALNKPKIGETILICDCGGGTVDITSYTIDQIEPTPMFSEVCVGIGGKCGATSIDRSLQQLMSKRFGDAWDSIGVHRKGPGSNFMNKWEIVKRQFGDVGDDRTHTLGPLNLKGVTESKWYDEEEGMVRLTKEDLKIVFEPTVGEIVRLVEAQKRDIEKNGQKLDRIVLVGGFGDSNYLFSRLKSWCEGFKIRAFCPEHPQAAIVRGAALRGLVGIAPRKRRCRRHYGFTINRPFEEGIDPAEDAYFRPYDGQKMCRNQMLWLAAKGDVITEATSHSHYIDLYNRLKETNMTADWQLYSCSEDTPPHRLNRSVLESAGNIHIDYSSVNVSKLPTRREFGIVGSRYYRLSFEIQVDFGAKSGSLEVRALCNGVVTGHAEIVYD
ncbi:hypothetical protein CKM354_001135000 [Cercospora kikuchii]|uniref:Actin-like ATPase domain-containing protein n=1 Tax=Cercospora kikuchii TaxID=84275 RepID=A0A9P3CS41_9PEZI|nr:uncharacterized protein CKM354_001135000 [Cercospora kikuchii]GIZ48282.1 hypothetical protein CKM354_001135000 [Cercospora kikuchii]